MKINDIYESTTAGAIATVSAPMSTQSRNASIYGGKKGGNLLTGKKTNKKYANSISESKMKQLAMDLKDMDNGNFKKKYGKDKEQMKFLLGDPEAKKTVHENAAMDYQTKKQLIRYADAFRMLQILEKAGVNVLEVRPGGETAARFLVDINGRHHLLTMNKQGQLSEAHLEEDDLILVPGQGHRLKSGFIPHEQDRRDHEVEMAKSDLFQAAKNAKQVYELIHDVTEDEGLEGWVQEKIIKANDYLNTIREYLEGKQLQNEMNGGVIAGGGVGEGVGEKIKGAIRREKAKDLPLVQTRRDYAMGKAGEAYNKGETRKGNQYSAWAEKDRKKKGDPTTNPAGTYRTKTSDYTNENAWNQLGQRKPNTNLPAPDRGSRVNHGRHFEEGDIVLPLSGPLKGQPHKVIHSQRTSIRIVPLGRDSYPGDTIAPRTKHEWVVPAEVNEAQSMGTALKNTLAKAEPGSKLDNSIKSHNRHIKAGLPGTLKNAPTGYHFDSKGYCRLGDK